MSPLIEIARNYHKNPRTNTVDLFVKVDGRRLTYVYENYSKCSRDFNKLLKAGAEYLDLHEESKEFKWGGVERVVR